MDEARDLADARQWQMEKRIEEALAAIKKNNMTGIYARDKAAALNEILLRIPKNSVVSHGGSRSLVELGIDEVLGRGGYQYLPSDPTWNPFARESRLKDFTCDVYLTSVNALTLKGELVVLDGVGNRAACLFFGPGKVLVVTGRNKIVDTLEDGIKRIREYVAPIHAKRRGWDVPCTKAGRCVECRSPMRICNKLAVLQYETNGDRTTVIIVGTDLGI